MGPGPGMGLRAPQGNTAPFNPLIVVGTVAWAKNGAGMATGSWTDSSGNGNTFTAGNAPSLVTNQINGLSVLRGTTAGVISMATAGGVVSGNHPHTIFCVARFNSTSSAFCGFLGYGGSNTGYGSSLIGADNTNKVWFGGSNNVTPVGAVEDASFHVWSKTFDGSTIKGYIDGVQVATLGGVTMALGTQMTLFRYATTTGGPNCDIAEAYFNNTAVSAGDFTFLNRGFGAKFALAQP